MKVYTFLLSAFLLCTAVSAAAGGGPVHFVFNGNTGNNATIIFPKGSLPGLETGDEIGVFNLNGNLAGSTVFEGGTSVITAWGNESAAGDTIYMGPNEPFSFRVWIASLDEEFVLSVTFSDGPDYYAVNGISTVATTSYVINAVADDIRTAQVYPNPVHSILNIALNQPVSGEVHISIFNATGALVSTPMLSAYPLGRTLPGIDVSSLPAGTYFFRVSAGNQESTGSFIR